MALDVWIGDWNDPGSELAASFDPEAYYWFLYPLIERLQQSHGKYIDLYGGCEFSPNELALFEKFLSDAEALVQRQHRRFRVHTGTRTQPIEKERYSEVDRESFLGFLASLRSAVRRCVQASKSLRFYGD